MSQEEAKTKWCPQARVVGILNDTYVPAGNRAATSINDADVEWNDNPESCRCIASACMAWRWETPAQRIFSGTEDTRRDMECSPERMVELGWTEVRRHKNGEPGQAELQCRDLIEWSRPAEGFCGLAGHP